MKKTLAVIAAAFMVALIGYAADFETLSTAKHDGKTGLKDLTTDLDANFALISGGTLAQTKVTFASSNVVLIAQTIANRAALVTSTVTTNLPVGSIVISSSTGKFYHRLTKSSPSVTSDWYTVTSANAE